MKTNTLLFVDDEPDFEDIVRQTLAQQIKEGKYKILFAHSGREALQLIDFDSNNEIDLLITDLKMPSKTIDGISLIKTLREKNIFLKTIVISAYGDFENFRAAIKEHVLDFITKTSLENFNLQEIIEKAINQEDFIDPNAQKLPYKTIVKLVEALPPHKISDLVKKCIYACDIKELEKMRSLNKLVEEVIDLKKSIKMDQDDLVEKIKRKEISIDEIDIELFNAYCSDYAIYQKMLKQNGKYYGPYYYLQWQENGKNKSIYLGKKNSD